MIVLKDPLDALETIAASVPDSVTKHDPQPLYDTLIDALRAKGGQERQRVLAALPAWLRDDQELWHRDAAFSIAVALRDADLMDAAVADARRRGVHESDLASEPHPSWLSYHYKLVGSLSHFPVPSGVAYLRELKERCGSAASTGSRSLCAGAWLTLCFIGEPRTDCFEAVIRQLRRWGQPEVTRYVLAPLRWFVRRHHDLAAPLSRILTPDEARVAGL